MCQPWQCYLMGAACLVLGLVLGAAAAWDCAAAGRRRWAARHRVLYRERVRMREGRQPTQETTR